MYKIRLKVETENELNNSFDPLEDCISDDVKSYIIDRASHKNYGEDIELQIITETPINEERLTNAMHRWALEEKDEISAAYRRNLIQQLWMFGIGVVFIAISLLLESRVGVVFFTVLSTIGAFSIWEAASIWIVQNPKLRLRKRIIGKIENQVRISIDSPQE